MVLGTRTSPWELFLYWSTSSLWLSSLIWPMSRFLKHYFHQCNWHIPISHILLILTCFEGCLDIYSAAFYFKFWYWIYKWYGLSFSLPLSFFIMILIIVIVRACCSVYKNFRVEVYTRRSGLYFYNYNV